MSYYLDLSGYGPMRGFHAVQISYWIVKLNRNLNKKEFGRKLINSAKDRRGADYRVKSNPFVNLTSDTIFFLR